MGLFVPPMEDKYWCAYCISSVRAQSGTLNILEEKHLNILLTTNYPSLMYLAVPKLGLKFFFAALAVIHAV